MNKFLGSIRIISIQKELVATGGSSYWSFVIEYYYENNNLAGRKNKIDYREVLSEEDFAVYSTLRELRKQIAEREGVPVYAVFTNEQLSEMVKKRVISKNMLSQIPGIGEKKVGSYGEIFIQKLKGINETGREPLQQNSNK
ncbi:MAG: HRDC domain-containing protein [Spirochaetales bacterium]|nr:HRDC domain-containing protein [Spirochaetales bacterium]